MAGCAGATTAGLRGGALDAYFLWGENGESSEPFMGDEW